MSERKINLDDYVDDLPLAVASYRNKLKIVMKELIKETLKLAAENANIRHDYYDKWDEYNLYNKPKNLRFERCDSNGMPYGIDVVTINKQSILNTINQIE